MTWPDDRMPIRVEMAFGRPPGQAVPDEAWTDVTGTDVTDTNVLVQEIQITRGRADESSETTPTAASLVLDNPRGAFTPDNPRSPYWPNVIQGTPARVSIAPGAALQADGALSGRAVGTGWDPFTDEVDIRFDVWSSTWRPTFDSVLVAQSTGGNALDNARWVLMMLDHGSLFFSFLKTGGGTTAVFSKPVPGGHLPSRQTIRFTMANVGGGAVAQFSIGRSVDGPFTPLDTVMVDSDPISIDQDGEPLEVFADAPGEVTGEARPYRLQTRSSIDGPITADAIFEAQPIGSTAWMDDAGVEWATSDAAVALDFQPRIVGAVDGWFPTWPFGDLSHGDDPGEARVEVSISGLLRRLETDSDQLSSALRRSIPAADPVAYWPLEDPEGVTRAPSALMGGSLMSITRAAMASDDTVPGSAPLPTSTTGMRLHAPLPATDSAEWEMAWVMHLEQAPTATAQILSLDTTLNNNPEAALTITTALNVALTMSDVGSGPQQVFSQALPAGVIGGPSRWVLRSSTFGSTPTSTTTFTLEITPLGGETTTISDIHISALVCRITAIATAVGGGFNDRLSIGHIAMWTEHNHAAIVYEAAANAYIGETAQERIVRLCDEEGVALDLIADQEVDEGAAEFALVDRTPRLGPQQIASFLQLLRDAAAADGGSLGERRDIVALVYRPRSTLYNQIPAIYLDAQRSEITEPLAPILDDQRLKNDITVSRDGGGSDHVSDEESVLRSGRYSDSRSLNLMGDWQLHNVAGWLLHLGTWPSMRYPQAATDLAVAPQTLTSWMWVDTADRLHIDGLPPQHPPGTVDLLVEGYTETISPTSWTIESNCTPGGPWTVGVYEGAGVDSDGTGAAPARYDTAGTLLARAVDLTGTGPVEARIRTLQGPRWTLDPDDWDDPAAGPLDVLVGPVRTRVTSIIDDAGGSSPVDDAAVFLSGPAAGGTSHTAPSVTADGPGLLLCVWICVYTPASYTVPPSMTQSGLQSQGEFSTVVAATEQVPNGATGTRTAAASQTTSWGSISVLLTGEASVASTASGFAGGDDVTLSGVFANVGQWLMAYQAWDWDPLDEFPPQPSDGHTWTLIADTVTAEDDHPHAKIWMRPVDTGGTQPDIGLLAGDATDDNQGRIWVFDGIESAWDQVMTVSRVDELDLVVPAGRSVSLADPARYAL